MKEIENFEKRYPFQVYKKSVQKLQDTFFFLAKKEGEKYLVVGKDSFRFFQTPKEAVTILQKNFPWLKPSRCGLRKSFGFGDRLGLATPGHLQALKGYDFFPVLAQQSIRELERTGRDFHQVLETAIIGAFQEGYQGPFGADADHIKDISGLKQAAKAGFTFFTIDPSGVIKHPENINPEEKKKILSRYWKSYQTYEGKTFSSGKHSLTWNQKLLENFVVTYAAAIDFIQECYLWLKQNLSSFDFEVSVDETPLATTPAAHVLIVEQLQRRQIEFQSLALRFPGKFEKGLDYQGKISEFQESLQIHQKIQEKLGPYKLSLHSGSDKFSVYPVFQQITRGNFHVKTSGTSWLEAVRTVALLDRNFFIEIVRQALTDFEKNAASYEVSARPDSITEKRLSTEKIETLFSDTSLRQIMHIAYGSILNPSSLFRERFLRILRENESSYHQEVKKHLGKHLKLLS